MFNKKKPSIVFNIIEIKVGWFDVMLMNGKKKSVITASDYLGNDVPKEFLLALCELSEDYKANDKRDKWLCWDNEPGASLWNIVRKDDKVKICVFNAQRPSFDIFDRNSLDKEEIDSVEIIVEGFFKSFCMEVIKSFENIINTKGIQYHIENWNDFPSLEFDRLKKSIL